MQSDMDLRCLSSLCEFSASSSSSSTTPPPLRPITTPRFRRKSFGLSAIFRRFVLILPVLSKLLVVLHYSSASPTYYHTSSPSCKFRIIRNLHTLRPHSPCPEQALARPPLLVRRSDLLPHLLSVVEVSDYPQSSDVSSSLSLSSASTSSSSRFSIISV
jgi:hypothetical protein